MKTNLALILVLISSFALGLFAYLYRAKIDSIKPKEVIMILFCLIGFCCVFIGIKMKAKRKELYKQKTIRQIRNIVERH